jgi:hypothetical protein
MRWESRAFRLRRESWPTRLGWLRIWHPFFLRAPLPKSITGYFGSFMPLRKLQAFTLDVARWVVLSHSLRSILIALGHQWRQHRGTYTSYTRVQLWKFQLGCYYFSSMSFVITGNEYFVLPGCLSKGNALFCHYYRRTSTGSRTVEIIDTTRSSTRALIPMPYITSTSQRLHGDLVKLSLLQPSAYFITK